MKDVLSLGHKQGVAFEQLGLEEIYGRFDFTRDPKFGFSHEWFHHCQMEDYRVFEYPTREFTGALVDYLAGRIDEIRNAQAETVRVLEVAAGQGILGLCVAKELTELGLDFELIGVDDQSWSLARNETTAANKADYVDAVPAVQPSIIIGAWIPFSRIDGASGPEDWSPVFRACPATEEYILIGRTEGIGSHAAPETWGMKTNRLTYEDEPVDEPEYERDGFRRTDFEDMRELQLCDRSHAEDMHQSLTVSFRR